MIPQEDRHKIQFGRTAGRQHEEFPPEEQELAPFIGVQERGGAALSGVARHGGPLGLPGRGDVHPQRYLLVWNGMNLTHLKLLGQAAGHSESIEGSNVVIRGIGLDRESANRDVVWMARKPIRPECENDLGSDLEHEGQDVRTSSTGIGLSKMPVLVVQDARRLEPESGASTTQFSLAHVCQVLRFAHRRVATRAGLAAGRCEHVDLHTLSGEEGQRPTRAKSLVVRVGENSQGYQCLMVH